MPLLKGTRTLTAVAGCALSMLIGDHALHAASHREAPLIAQDPAADLTDVYAFRSWEDPSKVVLIMNVIPAQEPSSGPNYFFFDDKIAYDFNLDLDRDGRAEDVVYRIRFKTKIRPPFDDLPVSYAGVDGVAGLPQPIRDLNGPDATGLRQTYTVTRIRNGREANLGTGTLFSVPSNIGPRTTPDYADLADRGIYSLKNGGRVFAGQRDETFYIDLGATFDTLNFRAAPILDPAADANDNANSFGVDMFSGFNVNTIALEIPIAELVQDGNPIVGMYASTSRPRAVIQQDDGTARGVGKFVQVARMANPLVNELIIGTGRKDFWNATDPATERQFVNFYLNPRLVTVVNLAFGTAFPTTQRTDLVAALLTYPGQNPADCAEQSSRKRADRDGWRGSRCSELLRLDTTVHPTAPDAQKRLGVLAGDAAGFPNGRRPNDDVTDIVLRVAAGALSGPVPALGDGVNFNIGAPGPNVTANGIYTQFPFLPTPHDGRNRRHIDCDEADAAPCN